MGDLMRRLLMSTVFSATMLLVMFYVYPVSLSARPCYITDILYYDSSCNEEIGEDFVQCDGINIHWGDRTPSAYWVAFQYCCGNESCSLEGDGCGGEGDYLGCVVSTGCTGTLCCGNYGNGVSWVGPCE
jgi:hypothetical protein